jgi:uncharacterized protein YyaL (SSP411 family)
MRRIIISTIACLFVVSISAQSVVKWYTIEEAFALTKKEPRKIMIDVYTDWCGWCKTMDSKTFNNPVIAAYLNKTYYPVKFNAEQKADVTLNGNTYKFVASGSKGYNQLAYELLNGKLGYPSIVFLTEDTKMLQLLQGYYEPKSFDVILKFFGGNAFKTTKWEDFQASYVSPIQGEPAK